MIRISQRARPHQDMCPPPAPQKHSASGLWSCRGRVARSSIIARSSRITKTTTGQDKSIVVPQQIQWLATQHVLTQHFNRQKKQKTSCSAEHGRTCKTITENTCNNTINTTDAATCPIITNKCNKTPKKHEQIQQQRKTTENTRNNTQHTQKGKNTHTSARILSKTLKTRMVAALGIKMCLGDFPSEKNGLSSE